MHIILHKENKFILLIIHLAQESESLDHFSSQPCLQEKNLFWKPDCLNISSYEKTGLNGNSEAHQKHLIP